MENICTAYGKNATTTKFPTPEISSSNLHTLCTVGRTTNLDSIYTSYKPLLLTVTQLLRREPFLMACHLSTNAQREASCPS